MTFAARRPAAPSWRAFTALGLSLWLVVAGPAPAGDTAATLPEPLTLAAALAMADQPHPELLRARADLMGAEAQRELARSDRALQVDLVGRLRWVTPAPASFDTVTDDHSLILQASKRLYDFGQTRSALEAADLDLEAQRLLLQRAQNLRRVQILAAFLDVHLADLAFVQANEAMAIAYVRYDAVRDRHEQGLVSDVDLLAAEVRYQESRRARYEADVARRSTRERLAALLNHPGELPSSLEVPRFPGLDRRLPDAAELQARALAHNPELLALRRQVDAARQRVAAARAGRYPVLDAEFVTGAYTRQFKGRDQVRAGVVFEVPLVTGGAVDARVGESEAERIRAQAGLREAEMRVRQEVLDLRQRVYVLQAQRDQARVTREYRDLYLDRSRALYELDLRTDLGDAMVQYSAARLLAARTDYELAVAFARLDALLGRQVDPLKAPAAAGTAKKE